MNKVYLEPKTTKYPFIAMLHEKNLIFSNKRGFMVSNFSNNQLYKSPIPRIDRIQGNVNHQQHYGHVDRKLMCFENRQRFPKSSEGQPKQDIRFRTVPKDAREISSCMNAQFRPF